MESREREYSRPCLQHNWEFATNRWYPAFGFGIFLPREAWR